MLLPLFFLFGNNIDPYTAEVIYTIGSVIKTILLYFIVRAFKKMQDELALEEKDKNKSSHS